MSSVVPDSMPRRSARSPIVPSKKRSLEAPSCGRDARASPTSGRPPDALPVLSLLCDDEAEEKDDVDYTPVEDDEPAEEFDDTECIVERGDDAASPDDIENVADTDLLDAGGRRGGRGGGQEYAEADEEDDECEEEYDLADAVPEEDEEEEEEDDDDDDEDDEDDDEA